MGRGVASSEVKTWSGVSRWSEWEAGLLILEKKFKKSNLMSLLINAMGVPTGTDGGILTVDGLSATNWMKRHLAPTW